MNVLKWFGCVIAAILLVAIVIGVYAFIHIIIAVVTVVFLVWMAAIGIRAYFKSRPRKM
jgi:hypothetical protein